MRLPCPLCGDRDRREFYYQGHAVMLERPSRDAVGPAWDDYLHKFCWQKWPEIKGDHWLDILVRTGRPRIAVDIAKFFVT